MLILSFLSCDQKHVSLGQATCFTSAASSKINPDYSTLLVVIWTYFFLNYAFYFIQEIVLDLAILFLCAICDTTLSGNHAYLFQTATFFLLCHPL